MIADNIGKTLFLCIFCSKEIKLAEESENWVEVQEFYANIFFCFPQINVAFKVRLIVQYYDYVCVTNEHWTTSNEFDCKFFIAYRFCS